MNLDTDLLADVSAAKADRPALVSGSGAGPSAIAEGIGYALGLDIAFLVRCAEQIADLYQEVTDLREQVARISG